MKRALASRSMGLKDGYQGPAVHAATVVPLPGLGAEELSEGLTARGEGSGGNSEIRALRLLQRESEPGLGYRERSPEPSRIYAAYGLGVGLGVGCSHASCGRSAAMVRPTPRICVRSGRQRDWRWHAGYKPPRTR